LKISVVVPVFNGEAFIRDCIASVLAQTHPPCEIVVVNDGSTDGTGAALLEFGSRIRVIEQANRGRSAARNAGIAAAGGEYVAFLDADDRYAPGHLQALAGAAPGAEIVHDAVRLPYLTEIENRAVTRRRAGDRPLDHLYRFQVAIQASMVHREWLLAQRVSFCDRLEIAEDALFFWSLILLGARIAFVPAEGVRIGIHAGNTTHDLVRTYRSTRLAYEQLDRFIRERGLRLSPAACRRIRQGRTHIEILGSLLELYRGPAPSARRGLRAFLARPAVSAVDRIRCLAGQVWPHFPGARRLGVLRALFGYSVLKFERPS
jgi:glycosyltransferase involved in cell wall biosynthesis